MSRESRISDSKSTTMSLNGSGSGGGGRSSTRSLSSSSTPVTTTPTINRSNQLHNSSSSYRFLGDDDDDDDDDSLLQVDESFDTNPDPNTTAIYRSTPLKSNTVAPTTTKSTTTTSTNSYSNGKINGKDQSTSSLLSTPKSSSSSSTIKQQQQQQQSSTSSTTTTRISNNTKEKTDRSVSYDQFVNSVNGKIGGEGKTSISQNTTFGYDNGDSDSSASSTIDHNLQQPSSSLNSPTSSLKLNGNQQQHQHQNIEELEESRPTLKELEETIENYKKENFSLKLKLYYQNEGRQLDENHELMQEMNQKIEEIAELKQLIMKLKHMLLANADQMSQCVCDFGKKVPPTHQFVQTQTTPIPSPSGANIIELENRFRDERARLEAEIKRLQDQLAMSRTDADQERLQNQQLRQKLMSQPTPPPPQPSNDRLYESMLADHKVRYELLQQAKVEESKLLTERNQQLERTIDQLKDDIEDLWRKIRQQQQQQPSRSASDEGEIKRLSTLVNDLKAKLDESKLHNDEYSRLLDDMKAKSDDIRSRYEGVRRENDDLKRIYDEIHHRYEDLRKMNDDMRHQMEERDHIIHNLERTLQQRDGDINSLNTTITILKEEIDHIHDQDTRLRAEEITALRAQIKRLKDKAEEFTLYDSDLTIKNNQLQTENIQIKMEKDHLEAENQQIKLENQQTTKENSQLKVDNQQIKLENKQLKADNQQVKLENQQIRMEHDHIAQENEKIREEMQQTKFDHQQSKADINLLTNENNQIKLENQQCKLELNSVRGQVNQMKIDKQQLESELEKFRIENFEANRALDKMEVSYRELQTQASEFMKKKQQSSSISTLESEAIMEGYRNQIDSLKRNLGERNKQLDDSVDRYRKLEEMLRKQMSESKDKRQELEKSIEQYRNYSKQCLEQVIQKIDLELGVDDNQKEMDSHAMNNVKLEDLQAKVMDKVDLLQMTTRQLLEQTIQECDSKIQEKLKIIDEIVNERSHHLIDLEDSLSKIILQQQSFEQQQQQQQRQQQTLQQQKTINSNNDYQININQLNQVIDKLEKSLQSKSQELMDLEEKQRQDINRIESEHNSKIQQLKYQYEIQLQFKQKQLEEQQQKLLESQSKLSSPHTLALDTIGLQPRGGNIATPPSLSTSQLYSSQISSPSPVTASPMTNFTFDDKETINRLLSGTPSQNHQLIQSIYNQHQQILNESQALKQDIEKVDETIKEYKSNIPKPSLKIPSSPSKDLTIRPSKSVDLQSSTLVKDHINFLNLLMKSESATSLERQIPNFKLGIKNLMKDMKNMDTKKQLLVMELRNRSEKLDDVMDSYNNLQKKYIQSKSSSSSSSKVHFEDTIVTTPLSNNPSYIPRPKSMTSNNNSNNNIQQSRQTSTNNQHQHQQQLLNSHLEVQKSISRINRKIDMIDNNK